MSEKSEVVFHYDIMQTLWKAYLDETTSNLSMFITYAHWKYSEIMTIREMVIIWQSFDMIYEQARKDISV